MIGDISEVRQNPNLKAAALPRFDSCRSDWLTLSLLHVVDPPCRLLAERHTVRNTFRLGKALGCIGSTFGNGLLAQGQQGADVGDKLRVKLIRTDIQRGYIDFARD